MNCPVVTVDLTMDDDSDTDSCVAEVAAYIRSTPARPPSSNGIVDLTVSPIPVSPRTEGNSSAMHAHRTIDEFSGGLLSPSKKIKTEHSSIGNGSFMLHKVKDEPGTSLYSSIASAATPLPLCNSSDAVPTEHSACRSTNTSTHSYQTAADSEEMILANRLTIPDCISPSTSFYSANQSIGLISPQAQVLSPGPISMQPFNFSESTDKNRSEGTSCVGASFISPAASVDDTSFAMEVDCSADVPMSAKGMTIVTPKAPTLLPQPAPPAQVYVSPSTIEVSVPVSVTAAPVTSITAKPVSALKLIETDKTDALCAQPKAVSSAPEVAAPVSVAVPSAAEIPVVPCGVQISTILHNLQIVLDPLINLVDNNTNPSTTTTKTSKTATNGTPSDAPSLASSLTVDPLYRTTTTSSSSRAIRSDKKTLSTELFADSEMQTKKLKYLDKILFPSLHSDTKAAELSQNGEVLHIIEQALRNNFNSPGVMKRIERALQQSDGPVGIYLMLMESKVDVLKQLQRKEGSKPDPQVFGLGSLPSLRALLSRLFHLPSIPTEESDLLPRSNHSSGEKSVRGELHNTNNNTNNAGNATVGIVAKSSQRKSKISKKASTYTTTTNNPTKDFTTENTDPFTRPNTTSFGNNNSKNTNLRPGVSIINTNNPIIRTEMDSLRVLAEADSAECAVGLRILNAWVEYMLCVRAHYQRNTSHNPGNTDTNSVAGLSMEVVSDALCELHAFATDVRNSTTVSTLIDGARRNVNDLDTLAEADAKRAAVLIEELAAAVYDVFVSKCVVTNTQMSSKSKSSSIMDEDADLIQSESASEKGFDVLYSVLSLETKLPSPTQWAAEREDEEVAPYEKYIQELLTQSVSLLDAALRPWNPNTGGTIATTSASVHCTALQSRGVVVVRYLLAQLKCILARLRQNLEDVAEKNVVLSELADTSSLRKINTNYGRILKTFLHRVKIVLFYRGNIKDKVRLCDAAESEDEALCDNVEALLMEHNSGTTSSSNKKRTAESRMIDIINHLTLECRV